MRRSGPWRLGIRMYNVTDELALAWDRLLHALIEQLRARGWQDEMQIVPQFDNYAEFWSRPDLLFGQTCGHPLVTSLKDHVQVLGTPTFNFPHCDGLRYCSLLLVREDGGIRCLEDLRGRRAAMNGPDSHSGMSALRHSVAPLAKDGQFFGSVLESGGHRLSIESLQRGEIDVAAIDCVHYGYALRDAPERLQGLRILHVSEHAPGLPFIASNRLDAEQLAMLRAALLDLPQCCPELMETLAIQSIEPTSLEDYQPIVDMELRAVELGYPRLA